MSNMDDTIPFSVWLDEKMKIKGWEISDLARRANVDRQVIWNYLNKPIKNPQDEKLIAIAKALGVPNEMIFAAAGKYYPDTKKIDDPWVIEMEHKIKKIPASLRPIAETLLDSLLEQDKKMTVVKTKKKIITNEK